MIYETNPRRRAAANLRRRVTELEDELGRIRASLFAAGMSIPDNAPTLAPMVSALDTGWQVEAERISGIAHDLIGWFTVDVGGGRFTTPPVSRGQLEDIRRMSEVRRMAWIRHGQG